MQLLGREIGLDQPLFLIAGPCVVESEELQLRTAEKLKEITGKLGVHFIFKSSFDKANRSSDKSFRGPGMDDCDNCCRVDSAGCVVAEAHQDGPARAAGASVRR